MDGVIIKAYGGFYFVLAKDRVLRCTIRGKIRRQSGQALVGDRVNVKQINDTEGVVEAILPRSTELIRPPVANVEQAVIVFAISNPEPSAVLLDRFLVQAQAAGISPVICFNKFDLSGLAETEQPDIVKEYRKTGLPVFGVSAKTGVHMDNLRAVLKERITVFAGPSGVGKSSLLNALQPGLALKTGDISTKLKRGKHTTRHVELLPLAGGGLVADTPGFSSMRLPAMRREDLAGYFNEFAQFEIGCKFTGCLHNREPGCAVKAAVERGKISSLRYRHYLDFLAEVMEEERRY
ncbi:putative ribosome biogenesis GTPase RsgA [Sporotomaculum syntrophicum]|uniref:Small ribosomal subunit biogenesis GTPase RsgA n=1 Tax=Sporotomaculum syntrophicum TaxID=182264 RepID=A0A9D3B0A7_9FIRM|nr:ribosome small subunit-dependent GTPase A [Sporotomaculum syntrophicum]KAF1086759.1 putative ribosome biogenesis GTPase RsgA [Sporotomaculum syntrophicum]